MIYFKSYLQPPAASALYSGDYYESNQKEQSTVHHRHGTADGCTLVCHRSHYADISFQLGFSSQWIYINTSIIQGVNVLTITLCSTWADNGSVIRRTALVEFPYALLYLLYIPLCLWKSASLLSFVLLTGICLLQSICIALWTICEYKLPYYIYGPKDYGSVLAISGIISSLLSLCTGSIITQLTRLMSYSSLMLVSCAVSTVLMMACAILHGALKPIGDESPIPAKKDFRDNQKTTPLDVFNYPTFRNLIAANLFRGFGFGTTTVMAAVALDLGYNQSVSTSLVSIQALAALAGCALFGICNNYVPPKFIVLAGSLSFALLPLMLIHNELILMAVLTLLYLGRTLVDYAVPSILRLIIPAKMAGPFNAWRMLLHNTGTLIATSIAAFIPVESLLIVTMVFQIISGISYFTSKDLRAVK